MATTLESLRRERQRKLQVRESFSGGLQHFRERPGEGLGFLLACADYLVAGQRRLIDQDRRLADRLAPRVPAGQAEDHAGIDALRGRLALADRTLADFAQGVATLRQRGAAGIDDFQEAAARFLDVVVNVLGARSHSLRHLTTTLLTEEDWQHIADITPEFLAAEESAFASIGRLAPRGLEPENMSTEPRGQRHA